MARLGRPLESAGAWYAALGVVCVGVLCVQSVLASELGWSVDLTPVAIAFLAVELELMPGLALAAAVAYAADALGGGPPGLILGGHLAAFMLLRLLVRRNPVLSPPVVVVLSALAAVSAMVARMALHAALGSGPALATELGLGRLAAVLVSAVPLYGVLRRVGEPFRPRDEAGLRR
jgi:hypothetical protein